MGIYTNIFPCIVYDKNKIHNLEHLKLKAEEDGYKIYDIHLGYIIVDTNPTFDKNYSSNNEQFCIEFVNGYKDERFLCYGNIATPLEIQKFNKLKKFLNENDFGLKFHSIQFLKSQTITLECPFSKTFTLLEEIK